MVLVSMICELISYPTLKRWSQMSDTTFEFFGRGSSLSSQSVLVLALLIGLDVQNQEENSGNQYE